MFPNQKFVSMTGLTGHRLSAKIQPKLIEESMINLTDLTPSQTTERNLHSGENNQNDESEQIFQINKMLK